MTAQKGKPLKQKYRQMVNENKVQIWKDCC